MRNVGILELQGIESESESLGELRDGKKLWNLVPWLIEVAPYSDNIRLKTPILETIISTWKM